MMEGKKQNQQNFALEKPVFKEGTPFAKLMKNIHVFPIPLEEEDEEALPNEKEESNLKDRWWEKITDGIPAEKRRAIEKTVEEEELADGDC